MSDWMTIPGKLQAAGFTVCYERISYAASNPLWRSLATCSLMAHHRSSIWLPPMPQGFRRITASSTVQSSCCEIMPEAFASDAELACIRRSFPSSCPSGVEDCSEYFCPAQLVE